DQALSLERFSRVGRPDAMLLRAAYRAMQVDATRPGTLSSGMIGYAHAPLAIRADLVEAHAVAWARLARPGAWLDGATRVQVAAEVRLAPSCALCRRRKEALSPWTIGGRHDSLGHLPELIVEQIHGIIGDPGRLTRRWFEGILAAGTTDTEYVEIVGVVATV